MSTHLHNWSCHSGAYIHHHTNIQKIQKYLYRSDCRGLGVHTHQCLYKDKNTTNLKVNGVWYCIFTAEVKQNFVKIFRVCSLVPGPHPDFISQPWRKTDFSPRLRDKIWVGPGDEATEFVLDHLGPQLKLKVYQDMFVDQICSEQSQRDRSTAALHQWKHNCQHNHCYQDRAYQLK